MREYFDLDKQIVHLAIDKSVMFERSEIDIAKKMLRDNNYHNWASCSKIKFIELIGDSMIMYKTASFRDWKEYFEMDCHVSKHLMGNLIDFERTINSRVSHYISELMKSDGLTNYEKNEIILIISQIRNRKDVKFSNYVGEATWLYIPKMTFGEMKHLVFWFYDNKRSVYFKVVEGYSFLNRNIKKRFDELNRLRNNLFHFVPLTLYLTQGKSNGKFSNSERKKAVKWIFGIEGYQELRNDISEICFNADNYIAIKNSLRNVD